MKLLGIDYGTKRVGIAISDEAGEFAFPKAIVPAADAVKEVIRICNEEGVTEVILGESVSGNEQHNDTQAVIQRFADVLAAKLSVPIRFEREDFSSVEAHRYQVSAGSRDDSAAAIILQRFLDRRKR